MSADKKNIFYHVWHWLLNKGIFGAFITINIISFLVLSAAMAVLHWILKKS